MREYFGRELCIGDFVLVQQNRGDIFNALVVGKDEIYLGPSNTYKFGCVKSVYDVIKCDMTNANQQMIDSYNYIKVAYNNYNTRMVEVNQTLNHLEPLTILLNGANEPSLYLGYVVITYMPNKKENKIYKGYCYVKLNSLGIVSKGALNSLLHNPISVNKLFLEYRKEFKSVIRNQKNSSIILSKKISNNYIFKYANTPVNLQGLEDNFTKSYNIGLDKLIIDFVSLRETV